MSLRVHVHAVIWVDGKVAIYRRRRQERDHLALPGGQVRDRETVLDALRREVHEEIGRFIDVGELLFAAEVNATSRQDVVLIFDARLQSLNELDQLDLVDPEGPKAETVLPPVLSRLTKPGSGTCEKGIWLGELYSAQAAAHLAGRPL
jgi:ADP-ribose pyrophosphatase YjhB (NUDIX family)